MRGGPGTAKLLIGKGLDRAKGSAHIYPGQETAGRVGDEAAKVPFLGVVLWAIA